MRTMWIYDGMKIKFKKVPSNCPIALRILEQTNNRLESKNLIKDVFYQLENEGIIEKITINPEFYNYTWVKHKPGIKFDAQIITKIRPVFNGSLKNKESYSLNEAA